MAITGINQNNFNCCMQQPQCPDLFGCPPGQCPDFEIRRHDTIPPFRVSVSDCNGPLDLTDTIAEVSMWALAKFKKAVTATDSYFALADNVGFHQISVGDVIVIDRVRNPEQMIITGFDESLSLVQVQRGYNGTTANAYKKGQKIKVFRILNAVAETHTVTDDVTNLFDGSVQKDVVTDAQLVYNWLPNDTCLPGCFWLEFKLLKMTSESSLSFAPDIFPLQNNINQVNFVSTILPSVIPSFIPTVTGCELGTSVEWVRRFPLEGEGFLIKIIDSPTAESIL